MRQTVAWLGALMVISCVSVSQSDFFPPWMNTGEVRSDAPEKRWQIREEGGIVWEVASDASLPKFDHVELSGFRASLLVSYGAAERRELRLFRRLIVPRLRTLPNNTHASFSHNTTEAVSPRLTVNQRTVEHYYLDRVILNGTLTLLCHTETPLRVRRCLAAAVHQQAWIEQWDCENPTEETLSLSVSDPHYRFVSPRAKGVTGSYEVRSRTVRMPSGVETGMSPDSAAAVSGGQISAAAGGGQISAAAGQAPASARTEAGGQAVAVSCGQITEAGADAPFSVSLAPGESCRFYFILGADRVGKTASSLAFNPASEMEQREAFCREMGNRLVLETPDPLFNREFFFSKLRACESIFETKNGLMHAPGGGSYYAALWTNDQCEYANPFFAYTGYDKAIEQSVNCYRLFARYMKKDYSPLVSSIIAEGLDTWSSHRGDRGDAAMFAYGAARFALTYGNREEAARLWPSIQWGLEYCRRRKNADGVVESEIDELEGRFPTGTANLCTSSLYYDALISASYLAPLLGDEEAAERYRSEAVAVRAAIERYFGATMNGFRTYRYFKENQKLRSWIAIPLTMGILDRAEGTVAALYSDALWFGNGLLTQEGESTFWDRSTLYAFRGTLFAGAVETAWPYVTAYTQSRLLGEHVPYPIEAWPEGNQKHLSAEGALYCRVFTEGLLGLRPVSFRAFEMTPRLPKAWDFLTLQSIEAYGSAFDIRLRRLSGGVLSVEIDEKGAPLQSFRLSEGQCCRVSLSGHCNPTSGVL